MALTRTQRRHLENASVYVFATLYATAAMTPFIWILLMSLKTPSDVIAAPVKLLFKPTLANYEAILFGAFGGQFAAAVVRVNIPQAFLNSIIIAGGATIVAMVLGNLAAYALARYTLPRKEALAFFFLSFRFCPTFAFIIPLFVVYQRIHLYNTYPGLILADQLIVIPLVVWVTRSFYESIPPELFEAATTDGATQMQILRRIALPLAAPGLAATAILAFIACWNNFTFPLILGSQEIQPITLATTTFISYEQVAWGMMTAAAVVTLVPELILALIVQRYIVQGLTYGAVKE